MEACQFLTGRDNVKAIVGKAIFQSSGDGRKLIVWRLDQEITIAFQMGKQS
jgi:hypothetical protein